MRPRNGLRSLVDGRSGRPPRCRRFDRAGLGRSEGSPAARATRSIASGGSGDGVRPRCRARPWGAPRGELGDHDQHLGVELFRDGQPTNEQAPNASAGLTIKSHAMGIVNGGHEATVAFGAPLVFASYQLTSTLFYPPSGPRDQISVDAHEMTSSAKARGDQFVLLAA